MNSDKGNAVVFNGAKLPLEKKNFLFQTSQKMMKH